VTAPALPYKTLPAFDKPQSRSFSLTKDCIDIENRTVDVAFSSETPVERWFGFEILDHSSGAVDLSRLNSGGAVLVDHNTRDQVGVVQTAVISADRIGRAKLKFGQSARAKEIFQDVVDGIRPNVSVQYEIKKMVRESEAAGVETFRATSWTPFEISFTPIPADHKVGVGRSADLSVPEVPSVPPIAPLTPTPPQMILNRTILLDPLAPAGLPAAPVTINVQEITNNTRTAEVTRVREIRPLAKAHNTLDIVDEAIEKGTEVDTFKETILKRYGAKPIAVADSLIGLSDKEIKQYSLLRALNSLANQRPLDGLELEASNAVAKSTRREAAGFFIPHDVSSRGFSSSKDLSNRELLAAFAGIQNRALNVTTATAGGFTVGTDLLTGSMIELLRNNMVVSQLGARSLSGLVGNIAIPKHTGGATAYWLAEGATITPSQQTFGQLGLTPRSLNAYTAYTKQLLAQSSIDMEAFVRGDLMAVLAIAKDLAAINGAGGAEPVGILNTTGVGTITYSGAATWAKVVESETTLATANAHRGNIAWLSSPATRGKWKTVPKVTAQPIYLIEGGLANGYRFEATTQMPTSPTANQTILGNWSDLILADWAGIDITVDPYSLSTSGQVRIVVNLLCDIGVRNPLSFVVSTDTAAA